VRRNGFLLLSSLLLTPFLLAPLNAQDSDPGPERHEGTAPRSSAAKYRAHGEQDGLSIGAERLTRKQTSAAFAARLNRCCIVVEVAVYPKKDELTELFLSDFTLVDSQTDTPVRPESATVVAAKLVKPSSSGGGGVQVTPVASVGYENGTYIDPITGQPVHVHGVSGGGGVGVSPAGSTPPSVADHDRDFVERELYEKGVPEAKVSIPVSGYLYFPIPKPNKDAKYRLVYSGKSEPLVLPLR
jgi:hypothetical protein